MQDVLHKAAYMNAGHLECVNSHARLILFASFVFLMYNA